MPQETSQPRPSDRWIPWYFVAFFVVLTSVLVPMCVIAVRTNTGLVTDHAYEKGLAYNKNIQADERQNALNWHGNLILNSLPENKLHVDFTLTDANNHPLEDAEVKFWLVRPTQAGKDQAAVLPSLTHGHYRADIPLPSEGLWEARVSATTKDQNYQITKRIVLP